jgi:hypothetical protein
VVVLLHLMQIIGLLCWNNYRCFRSSSSRSCHSLCLHSSSSSSSSSRTSS